MQTSYKQYLEAAVLFCSSILPKEYRYSDKSCKAISSQYWRLIGRAPAAGNELGDIFFQNHASWIPQGTRNAGLISCSSAAGINQWEYGVLRRELTISASGGT